MIASGLNSLRKFLNDFSAILLCMGLFSPFLMGRHA
jgi:hypothetical protein